MKVLRHSKTARERWDYEPVQRVVRAHFPDCTVDIPVCTQRQPRVHSFFISRRGEDEWQIAPSRWTGITAKPASYDANGVHCDFLMLVGAPVGINNLLADLYEYGPDDDDTPTQRMCPRCDAKGYTGDGECSLCSGNCAISFEDAAAWEKLTHD